MSSYKGIVVGGEEIFDYFRQTLPEWDLQSPVDTFEEMWQKLSTGELSSEVNGVFFLDVYLEEFAQELVDAIITISPAAAIFVLFYDSNNINVLNKLIQDRAVEVQKPIFLNHVYPLDVNDPNGLDPSSLVPYYLEQFKESSSTPQGSTETPTPPASPALPDRDENTTPVDVLEDYIDATQESINSHPDRPHFNHPDRPHFNDVSPTSGNSSNIEDIVSVKEDITLTKRPVFSDDFVNLQGRATILCSTSSKGGTGKSTVAICTAGMLYHASLKATQAGLREKPLRVCVIDLDVHDGQIGFLLAQDRPTVLNVFVNKDRSVESIEKMLVHDEKLGIYVLLATKQPKMADFLTPIFYQDVIQKLSTVFDVVVLDTSVQYLNDKIVGELALPISDRIMFVTEPGVAAVFGMRRWMGEVTVDNGDGSPVLDINKIGVVVNKSAADLGIDASVLERAANGAELLGAIPMDTMSMMAAGNMNRFSDILYRHTYISRAYFNLVSKLFPNEPLLPLISDEETATSTDNNANSSGKRTKRGR